MSEKHLEELKKICLICGCHTNQTINIYEPRAGPNIVELIQAKFKFQPVNEDKYLCYSCNNWLINWHSLQTLNTESNSQAGKSRSRINDSIPEEDAEDNSEMHSEQNQQQQQQQQQPQQPQKQQQKKQQQQQHNSNKKRNGFYFSRRSSLGWHRIRKIRRKRIQSCTVCGRNIKKCAANKSTYDIASIVSDKCKNCRRILKWRAKYSKALIREEQRKLMELKTSKLDESGEELHFRTNLVNNHHQHNYHQQHYQQQQQQQQHHHHHQRQRPLVDGKVVAMLRRLGTTLTRESDCSFGTTTRTIITSDDRSTTPITIEKRVLDDDEILIDFNTAITEVLPFDLARYPVDVTEPDEQDVDDIEIESVSEEGEKLSLEDLYSRIPKCVTVSVVTAAVTDTVASR